MQCNVRNSFPGILGIHGNLPWSQYYYRDASKFRASLVGVSCFAPKVVLARGRGSVDLVSGNWCTVCPCCTLPPFSGKDMCYTGRSSCPVCLCTWQEGHLEKIVIPLLVPPAEGGRCFLLLLNSILWWKLFWREQCLSPLLLWGRIGVIHHGGSNPFLDDRGLIRFVAAVNIIPTPVIRVREIITQRVSFVLAQPLEHTIPCLVWSW